MDLSSRSYINCIFVNPVNLQNTLGVKQLPSQTLNNFFLKSIFLSLYIYRQFSKEDIISKPVFKACTSKRCLRVYLHVDRSTGAHHRLSAHKHHRCAPDRTGSTQLLFTTNGCEHPARCAPVRSIMTIHLYVVGPCLPCF